MAKNGGKKTFLAIVLGGIGLLAVLVVFVVYGMPTGGNTENLTPRWECSVQTRRYLYSADLEASLELLTCTLTPLQGIPW